MRPILFVAVLAAAACAQYPAGANALAWSGLSPAGPSCWGFSCTPVQAAVFRGETGSLLLRGDFGQPYAIGFSLAATRCLADPSVFYNMLVLDDPVWIVFTGVLATAGPILACPSGFDVIPVAIPATWPAGVSFSIQGAVGVQASPAGPGPFLSLTQAITVTVW